MLRKLSACFALSLVASCATPQPPKPEAFNLNIVEFECATDQDLAFGPIAEEVWGDGWHYLRIRKRCTRA